MIFKRTEFDGERAFSICGQAGHQHRTYLRYIYFYLCKLSACIYTTYAVPVEARRGATLWVLGTDPGFSARAVGVLNWGPSLQAQRRLYLKFLISFLVSPLFVLFSES